MNDTQVVKLLRIGPRVWKTGLAVALTVALVRLTGHNYEVYGAAAATLAVAPSAARSFRTLWNQIQANLIGCLVGAVAILLAGPNPVVIGAMVVFVLFLCQRFGFKELAPMVVTVTLFVMAPHSDSVTTYVFWRLLSVMTGCVVGTAVNALVLPPDYQGATLRAIDRAGLALDQFVLSLSGRLDRPHEIAKAEVLDGASRVEREITEARRLNGLHEESQRPEQERQQEVIDRAIRVMASLLERIQSIHKAALTAERASAYSEQIPEIQEALTDLVGYRKQLFAVLLKHDPVGALPLSLAELERRFVAPAGLPASEAEVEPFFRLYSMRSGVSYMANRLGRLYVAKETALPPALEEAGLGERVTA